MRDRIALWHLRFDVYHDDVQKLLMTGYRPLDWLMVRAPLLPIERCLGPAPLDHRVRRALAAGAGDLWRAVERQQPSDRARRKLQRYLIRMSTRPTPFGLFAGVGLAGWSERTDLAIGDDPARIRTRPDMGWLLDFVSTVERKPEIRAGLRTIDDLAIDRTAPALPSLDLSVFVLASSPEAVDAGDFQMMVGPNFGASAAGRVLGRFSDLLGEQARTALRSVADAEAAVRPGRVWAEVNYLPRKGRLGNVATRALVRDHELVLNTTPGGERIIRAVDLLVGVRDNRFVLRWSVTGHEVVPCSGHMLNPRSGSPVIQFLDDVSRDGYAMPSSFDWGPAANFPFLPRVQAGRIILTPARWLLRAEEFTQQWRERWQVPRHVYLSTADNRLLLDLADPDQLKQLPDKGLMVLQEALPAPDQAWLPGSEGRYVSEFVVPLIREEIEPEPEPARQIPSGRRMRPPGSDWLFAKLYHLPTFENDLLTGPVKDFCEGNWFFMRYVDPDPHLRIRWTGDPRWLTGELAPRVLRWSAELVERGYCTRVALDTYDRELERYGGPTALEAAESLFAADSSAVLDLLRFNDIDRTLLGMYTVDDLLVGLGLTEDERLDNYRLGVADRRATADEFRSRQVELRHALGNREFPRIEPILARRRAVLREVGDQLDWLAGRRELGKPKTEIARSFVHMHCNRLLGCGHPPEQKVLGLLTRTWESLRRAPLRRGTA